MGQFRKQRISRLNVLLNYQRRSCCSMRVTTGSLAWRLLKTVPIRKRLSRLSPIMILLFNVSRAAKRAFTTRCLHPQRQFRLEER